MKTRVNITTTKTKFFFYFELEVKNSEAVESDSFHALIYEYN